MPSDRPVCPCCGDKNPECGYLPRPEPGVNAIEVFYRVYREDTRNGYYHAPLKKIGTKRFLTSILQSCGAYSRYKILKIEKLVVTRVENVTAEYLPGVRGS